MNQKSNCADALRLRDLIRQAGDYGHVDVRAHGQHLIVELVDEARRDPVARATRLDSQTYGLSFRSHTGKWEPTPASGNLEEMARAMTEELGAYLDPRNL